MFSEIGRLLIVLGVGIAVIGVLLVWFPGLRIGRLPGDISFEFKGGRFYFPVVTSLLLSVLLTLLIWLIRWLTGK
jgi:hypothetical protein